MNPKIYLDTNVFVEAFERVDAPDPVIRSVLNAVEAGEPSGFTSEITYAESLPKLIIDDEGAFISLYKRLFSEPSLFTAVPITREILARAAALRAQRLSVRRPDAIHLATAAHSSCSAFVSNDRRLASVSTVPIVARGSDCLANLRAIAR